MNNPVVPLVLAFCLHSWTAYGFYTKGDYPMVLVWAAYAVSLIGFMWGAMR